MMRHLIREGKLVDNVNVECGIKLEVTFTEFITLFKSKYASNNRFALTTSFI